MVSRRTVYSGAQIVEMAQRETKAMLFRLVKHFDNPIPFQSLRRPLRVVAGNIQSITHISDESFSRILRAAER